MMAASPRNMMAVTRPEAPAAFTPSPAPRMTIAVLMNSSGRAAAESRAANPGKQVAHDQPRDKCDQVSRLAREPQRPRDSHGRSLVRREAMYA